MPSETDTSTTKAGVASEASEPQEDGTASGDADEKTADEKAAEDGLVEDGDAREQHDESTPKDSEDAEQKKNWRSIDWSKPLAFIVLPAMALLLAVAAGYLKWHNSTERSAGVARIESVAAAKDATTALLSYKPDTVEKDLDAARDRLTGTFKDSYTQLTHDVVIPGAKQKHISAVATVPAVASVTATPNHAVALLYVDQTTIVGNDAPSDSVSVVRVTLDNVNGRWLVSEFDPI